MTPEPTTVATRMAARELPQEDDAPEDMRGRSFGRRSRCLVYILRLADGIEPPLQGELIERADRETDEDINATRQHPQRISKGEPHFRFVAGRFRRIGYAPMGGHGLSRPHGAGFRRCVVADRENEIDLRCVRPGKLLPAF